jgi:hypothetical protein
MNSSCSLAEQEILARERDVPIQKSLHHVAVMLAQDAEPMQRPAAKGPDMPPLLPDFISPSTQALLAVDIELIGFLRLAAG